MIEIHLNHLSLPCSKNALHIPVRCGRWTKMVRSRMARIKGDQIKQEIWSKLGGRIMQPIFTRPVQVQLLVTYPDKRKRDLHNYEEHLYDILQEAMVIADDSLIVHGTREAMPLPHRPGWIDITLTELP